MYAGGGNVRQLNSHLSHGSVHRRSTMTAAHTVCMYSYAYAHPYVCMTYVYVFLCAHALIASISQSRCAMPLHTSRHTPPLSSCALNACLSSCALNACLSSCALNACLSSCALNACLRIRQESATCADATTSRTSWHDATYCTQTRHRDQTKTARRACAPASLEASNWALGVLGLTSHTHLVLISADASSPLSALSANSVTAYPRFSGQSPWGPAPLPTSTFHGSPSAVSTTCATSRAKTRAARYKADP